MRFNYQASTILELVEHLRKASIPSVSGLKAYYQRVGNTEMVEKISLARKTLKLERMVARTEKLKAEVSLG